MTPPRTVLVPVERVTRWFENFAGRHGAVRLTLADGILRASAEDGASAEASLPFGRSYDGPAEAAAFAAAAATPVAWGILLVRKGGFAVASVEGSVVAASKVGQRHVQGRTKAGGQSQQRFARRRDNQARAAYEAAADHAARIVGNVAVLVVGGDHAAVAAVLDDQRLREVASRVAGAFLPVPDPRRAVLEGAVADACSVTFSVANT
jgi:hypothetical protein